MHKAEASTYALILNFRFAKPGDVLTSILANEFDCVSRSRAQLQLSQHMNAGRPMPVVGAFLYGDEP